MCQFNVVPLVPASPLNDEALPHLKVAPGDRSDMIFPPAGFERIAQLRNDDGVVNSCLMGNRIERDDRGSVARRRQADSRRLPRRCADRFAPQMTPPPYRWWDLPPARLEIVRAHGWTP